MRLLLILPHVESEEIKPLSEYWYEDCNGTRFQFLQEVEKPLRDTKHTKVMAHRYQCLRCFRTHRVYPKRGSKDHMSQRAKGLGILLYLLGLNYGAVSLALEALGVYKCKSRVYDAVQVAAERIPGMERDQVFENLRTPVLGGRFDVGESAEAVVSAGIDSGGIIGRGCSYAFEEWMEPIAETVGAEVLVTNDADAFKTVADNLERDHQVYKSHVKRNTESLIKNLGPAVATDADRSLAAIGVIPEQAQTDLKRLGELIVERKPEDVDELGTMHYRYLAASPPGAGEKATTTYRLRLLFLDCWNLRPRLTKYRTWQGSGGETLDGGSRNGIAPCAATSAGNRQ